MNQIIKEYMDYIATMSWYCVEKETRLGKQDVGK